MAPQAAPAVAVAEEAAAVVAPLAPKNLVAISMQEHSQVQQVKTELKLQLIVLVQ